MSECNVASTKIITIFVLGAAVLTICLVKLRESDYRVKTIVRILVIIYKVKNEFVV